MKYYIIHENQIYIAENEQAFSNLGYMEQVHELPEDYNSEKYLVVDGELVINSNYEEEQILKRKADFESQFIETSYIKEIDGEQVTGWYRKVPKGYANAVQTMEIANRYITKFNGMTEKIAELLIFYQKPDFTKSEQCTEEWLIAHQFHPIVDMTLEQWSSFEFDFQERWAAEQYRQLLQQIG